MKTMDDFHHSPLENPAKDIRLLKCTDPTGHDGLLSFQISSWHVDQAPQYHAISYIWGEKVFTTIIIDGFLLKVRHNCHQALVQTLGYSPDSYLWIDSICINQDDVDEKSHQVARMYAVYAHAKEVLACVGPNDSDSEFLVRTYSAIKSRGLVQYLQETEANIVLTELSEEMNRQLPSEEFLARLRTAWKAFERRPYWNRLWIVQEIVAGADNTLILCGAHTIPWSEVNVIESLLVKVSRESRENVRHTPYSNLMQLSSEILWSEDNVLPLHDLQLAETECADSRDRIYGLLALIDWEASGLEPILPDYTRSAWDLATYLVGVSSPHDCRHILRRLKIHATTPEMQKLIREREAQHLPGTSSDQNQTFDFQRNIFLRLSRDDRGFFVNPCGSQKCPCLDPTERLRSLGIASDTENPEVLEKESRGPQAVYSGIQIIAVVSGETLPGDLLALAPFQPSRTGLILRSADGHNLDVVGTAWHFFEDFDIFRKQMGRNGVIPSIETAELPKDPIFQAELHLSATTEDMMVLFNQLENGFTDVGRFLTLQPIADPTNAAKITSWRYGHEAEAYWEMNRVYKLQMSEQTNERGL